MTTPTEPTDTASPPPPAPPPTTTAEDAASPTPDAAPPAPTPTDEERPALVGGGDDEDPEKEVVEGEWKRPDIHLEEVKVVTGEEEEIVEWTHRSKLYRWNDGQWKERGIGDSKLLRDKDGKIRFLLRQEKTHKIVANHYGKNGISHDFDKQSVPPVIPTNEACILRPNAGNDKIWTWSVLDSAEEPPVVEQFALRFATAESEFQYLARMTISFSCWEVQGRVRAIGRFQLEAHGGGEVWRLEKLKS